MQKILLVDDVPTFHEVLTPLVLAAGYQPLLAQDGMEARTTIETTPSIAGIITDVAMPVMNGVELLQYLLRTKRHVKTYIHSGESTLPWQGELINLPEFITTHFGGFASFMRKDGNMTTNVAGFLASLRA